MSEAEPSKPIPQDPYEKRDVSMTWIVAATAVCVVAVVISIVLLDFYFDYYRDKLHQELVIDRGHLLDRTVKEAAAENLSGEATADGTKRIPIDKAIEALAEDK